MLSSRDIQRKIRTVRNIQQICRAMKTVSSIKLRKAESRILAARPYADALRDMVGWLGGCDSPHPLLAVREVKRSVVVPISADKGLAGGYNTNVVRETLARTRTLAETTEVRVAPIGRKVADVLRRMRYPIETQLAPLGQQPEFRTLAAFADHIGEAYAAGEIDQVELIYTRFGTGVETIPLLPIVPPACGMAGDIIYEPSPAMILDRLLPRYLRTVIYTAVLSSVAAEHAARVAAMTLATENADDLIDQLTMDYNKSRQAGITNDLTDIVGAAEALG
jgi:F-type H+-transporting ATPase subunit gamma